MNVSDQVIQVMNEIAKQLGVAVEKVYPMLYKQSIIEGVVGLGWTVLGVGLVYVGYKKYIKRLTIIKEVEEREVEGRGYKFVKVSYEAEEVLSMRLWVCTAMILLGVLMIVANLSSSLTALINPDYYMIENIVRMVK